MALATMLVQSVSLQNSIPFSMGESVRESIFSDTHIFTSLWSYSSIHIGILDHRHWSIQLTKMVCHGFYKADRIASKQIPDPNKSKIRKGILSGNITIMIESVTYYYTAAFNDKFITDNHAILNQVRVSPPKT